MRDFQATTSVEPIAGMFAVVRVEQWRRTDLMAAPIARNKVMVDGPFPTRAAADDALARIDARGA